MDGLTLDQLHVFLVVAEQGSFSAAARELHRAQSAVSYAVANLERLLDVTLFDRSTRKPTLTEAGRSLVADARAILSQVDHLRARSRLIAGGTEPQVSLAVDMMFPMPALVDNLHAFREAHPTVPLHLHSEALGAVAKLVKDGTCQIGISGPLPSFPEGLEKRPLASVRVVSVVAPGHPLAKHPRPSTALLRKHVQLVLTDRSQLTQGTDVGVLSIRTWRMADLSTKHALLLAGFGWGNMPHQVVADDLSNGRLVRIQPEEWLDELRIPHYIIYRSSQPPGPAGKWLIDRLRQSCERSDWFEGGVHVESGNGKQVDMPAVTATG